MDNQIAFIVISISIAVLLSIMVKNYIDNKKIKKTQEKPFYPVYPTLEFDASQSIGIELSRDNFSDKEVIHLMSCILQFRDAGLDVEIRKSEKDIPSEYIGICNLYTCKNIAQRNYIELISRTRTWDQLIINKSCE